MSLYNTPGTSLLADEYMHDRTSTMLDHGDYRIYGGHIQRKSLGTSRQLRHAAIIALVCAPLSFLIAPFLITVLLGHFTLANTNRDGVAYEDRTRGIAVISLIVAYVMTAMLIFAALLAL